MAMIPRYVLISTAITIFICAGEVGSHCAWGGELCGQVREGQGYGDTPQPSLWPKPQVYKPSSTLWALVKGQFKFRITAKTCDLLEAALTRYYQTIFNVPAGRGRPGQSGREQVKGILPTVDVMLIATCETYPSLNMDEHYEIKIDNPDNPGRGLLTSQTIWGILRGLETFSQMVYRTDSEQLVINSSFIEDFPRFSHRGVLLDTSRHYLSKAVIKLNIEAMAMNKINVFHWHIVDDPSFPYQSSAFPSLSDEGAYNPYTHIYTQEDVREIIEFARVRGVRVVPEFDTPGHTQSWGPGVSNLLTPCYTSGKPDGLFGPVNPILNATYTFMKNFFTEISEVFKDSYIHLGGDEVSFSCWESNPDVVKFADDQGWGKNFSKVEGYYISNLLSIIQSLKVKRGYLIWQEVVDNNVSVAADTVVEVWKGNFMSELYNVTKAGYHSILASPWYLDYVSTGSDWKRYYMADPQHFNGSTAQKKLVIGGEACLWGEWVDDTNVTPRLWPRASAVAERLWSAEAVNNTDEALGRINGHTCRMKGRGIPAEPANGPGYCDYEFKYNW